MGKAELPLHAPGTQVDKGYIGQSVPRPNAARLLQGRGAFIDDMRETGKPQVIHVCATPLQQALRVGPRHRLADIAPVDLGPGCVERKLSLAH